MTRPLSELRASVAVIPPQPGQTHVSIDRETLLALIDCAQCAADVGCVNDMFVFQDKLAALGWEAGK